MAKYQPTPELEFQHPWINKPDTKYNDDGLYHVDGIGSDSDEDVMALKALIDEATDKAWDEMTAEMAPKEVKQYGRVYPYEIDEDDDGNPTGYIKFGFKQNAQIKTPKGVKHIKIEIRDADDEVVDVPVFGGTLGRIMFSMRAIKVASSKKIGVRLDFAKVQLIKLAEGSGGGGFGKVEGGYKGTPKGASSQDEGDGDDY